MNDGCLKFGDLGLSRYFSSKTHEAFSLVGTPWYMSPEAIMHEGYNFSSDVWSFGCCMYVEWTERKNFVQIDQTLII
jgi:NIMA (never in mitosis gene a)-related kinase